ncbi:NXPE family member 4-like isoform X1 [Mercenaria mercenaria]|uniref:NXPE family member 4-like isoform X1 n=2 Tax=Mercenaria mercenaria TaxID=6596 RepID=UPI00234EFA38|nr:NXPE family member 4-like isoform X1 [Mercenaria mercenaria]XP_045165755.2 NXPE family member 4-like isoform X1 [Mercenaria mercenaria]
MKINNGLGKTLVLIFAALLVVALVFVFHATRMFNISRQMFITSYAAKDYATGDPSNPTFYNLLLEEEALKFERCKDINKAASVQRSIISLTNHVNRTYNIGETIRATVTLHDGYNKRKYSGGDHLRARIQNKVLKASAPCIVTYNKDGTQTVACEALWTGTSTIIVTLAHTVETIATNYRLKTQVLATRVLEGLFKSRNYSEVTTCHPNHVHLLKHKSYRELCNMTYMNSGMPFYCGKPKSEHLLCEDWQFVREGEIFPGFQTTQCEQTLLNRGKRTFRQTLDVKVENKIGDNHVIDKPSVPCKSYNISLLWRSRGLTGFFFNGKWNLRNCFGFQGNDYKKCLENRHLYLFGDSTTRGWYKEILNRFKCQRITEKWWMGRWHKESECFNKQINFKAGWYPHAHPFFVTNEWDDVRYNLYSISRRIDNIPQTEHAIVVIHMYLHMLPFHHSVFQQKMKIIRKSVETFLEKNKYSIVMVKGPHTFEVNQTTRFRHSDYFGYLYSKIIYEVFEGLQDRIILLNNRDVTIAQPNKGVHPPKNVVNAMIDQMLSYVCDQ